MKRIDFTFEYLELELKAIKQHNYEYISCIDYVNKKAANQLAPKTVVLRVDIDLSVKKAERLLDIFNRLNLKSTFFIRLHAPEYNPFSFENYRIIRKIIDSGHEIGYHSEVVDEANIWNEDAENCLIRDIQSINTMYGIQIKGVASHGGLTGLNNLDFWNNRKPGDFGLVYEGYDKEPEYNIFQEAFYISDSEWIRWKCYDKGIRQEGDSRSPSEHLTDNHNLIHLLIHPDTYYDHHFYEAD
jgi:hypothetical protein